MITPDEIERYRYAEDEDSKATWQDLCKRHGEIPKLDSRNSKALNLFYELHNARTREFSGAWYVSFRTIPIIVDDRFEARHYLRAWDLFYSLITDVIYQRSRQENEREQRSNQAKKPLKIY